MKYPTSTLPSFLAYLVVSVLLFGTVEVDSFSTTKGTANSSGSSVLFRQPQRAASTAIKQQQQTTEQKKKKRPLAAASTTVTALTAITGGGKEPTPSKSTTSSVLAIVVEFVPKLILEVFGGGGAIWVRLQTQQARLYDTTRPNTTGVESVEFYVFYCW